LGLVCGARYPGRPGKDLFDHYLEGAQACKASTTEIRGYRTDNDCAEKFMAELEKEIHHMEGHRKYPLPKPPRKQIKDDLQPTGMKLLKCVIPDSSGLDRLLRYEGESGTCT
jgi:hypothetical protein